VAAELLRAMQGIDVLDRAAKLDVPTLILHCRDDMRVPFEEGCKLASVIPGARFVALDSANHVLLPDEPAWTVLQDELARFLKWNAPVARCTLRKAVLTPEENAVLQRVVEGLDNQAIVARLGKSEKTVRNQVSAILDKLGVKSRAQAIVAALAD
jgi:DNA-binding NarL/FixJ family response regulator